MVREEQRPTNSSRPFGAQSLRIRQELKGLHRGTLAVPAEDGGPALPLRMKPLSLARVLRDSRLQGLRNLPMESPSRRRRWAAAEKSGKDFSAGPPSETNSLSVINHGLSIFPIRLCFLPFPIHLECFSSVFSFSATVGRASAGGGRFHRRERC